MKILTYIDQDENQPFDDWFDQLNAQAAAKIITAVSRMGQGNFSNAEPVGGGLSEYKIDYGPGYRIYFGKDGDRIIILVGGGTKRRQSKDIAIAKARWADYKQRKKKTRRSR